MHWKKVMVTTIYKIDRKKDYKKTIYSWCPELCPTDHINFVSESEVSDAAKMYQVSHRCQGSQKYQESPGLRECS